MTKREQQLLASVHVDQATREAITEDPSSYELRASTRGCVRIKDTQIDTVEWYYHGRVVQFDPEGVYNKYVVGSLHAGHACETLRDALDYLDAQRR